MVDNSASASSSQKALRAGILKSVSSLMGLQLLSRIVTFSLNQALIHLATPTTYGTVSLHFELLSSTILFLSREGVRNALLRASPVNNVSDTEHKKDDDSIENHDPNRIANLTLLPILVGFPFSIFASTVYHQFASVSTKGQKHFDVALCVYTSAAILELFSEPYHIRAIQSLDTSIRVTAEGFGILAKALLTVIILYYDSKYRSGDLGLLAFAIGQLAYSLTLLHFYKSRYGKDVSLVLKRSNNGSTESEYLQGRTSMHFGIALAPYFDEEFFKISMAMSAQGILKHILTEGDKFIVSRTSPLKDQGGYAVAFNYGSLVARIIFQPIEETSRLYFSKILSPKMLNKSTTRTAFTSLKTILLFYSYLVAFVVSFGPQYLPVVMYFILPRRYIATSAPTILSAWIWYIPVLAINGVLEAFHASVATPSEIQKQSRWMALFSVVYITATVLLHRFTGLHDAAFVYGNMLNLILRIFYVGQFARNFFREHLQSSSSDSDHHTWSDIFPPKKAIIGLVFVGVLMSFSSSYNSISIGSLEGDNMQVHKVMNHSIFGLICFVAIVLFCWVVHLRYIRLLFLNSG